MNYTSLGASQEERDAQALEEPPPYKRQKIAFTAEYARDSQHCGGERALKAILNANRVFANALTCTNVEPKENSTRKYPDPTKQPRVLGLQIWMNCVRETKNTGGKLASDKRR